MEPQLERSLGRIEGKLEAVHTDVQELKTLTQDQEKRLGALERSRAWLAGVAAAAGAGASTVLSKIGLN